MFAQPLCWVANHITLFQRNVSANFLARDAGESIPCGSHLPEWQVPHMLSLQGLIIKETP
jgi:hypothetical protein